MAMSKYNRQNPFMYLLEVKQDELTQKSQNAIKHMIIMLGLGLSVVIYHCAMYIGLDINTDIRIFVVYMLFGILIIYSSIMTIIEVSKCVQSINTNKINTMIFGDEYKDININNEQLLAMINEYNISIGKVDAITESIKSKKLIYLIFIAIYIMIGISLLFNREEFKMKDMRKYMTVVKNNPTNSLKGVVTPNDQLLRKKSSGGLTLKEIIYDNSILCKFPNYTFPQIRIMDNGNMFMDPRKRMISNMHEYRIKWFVLNEQFEISHDHDYPFVPIPSKGYLMKISVPITSLEKQEYQIDYIIDINHIHTEVVESKTENGTTESELQLPECNFQMYPSVYELVSDNQEFFNKYLIDIVE